MKRLLINLLALLFTSVLSAQCLNGVYTIGGITPDYPTIGAAVSALSTNGICGPVTFNIRNGTYNEQLLVPAVSGSSATNTILFRSESGDSSQVIISFAGTSALNYVVKFDGTNYAGLRYLSVTNTSTTYTGVVNLGSGSELSVQNCKLTAAQSSSTTTAFSVIYTSNFTCDSLLISNNNITGGSAGIKIQGYVEAEVSSNRIFSNGVSGIDVRNYDRCVVRNNYISSTAPLPFVGISASSIDDSLKITGNSVLSSGRGITLSFVAAPAGQQVIVANNFVKTNTQNAFTVLSTITNLGVYHNTFIASTTGKAVDLQNGVTGVEIRNNVFSVATGVVYLLYSAQGITLDYNVIYRTGSTLGTLSITSYADLMTWRVGTGFDVHSVFSQPALVVNDYHVTTDFSQNMPCAPVPGIAVDADGDSRGLIRVYPGADEFTFLNPANEAGTITLWMDYHLSCSSANTVKATIRNYGGAPLTSVSVNWSVNNVIQPPVIWTGSLANWDTTQVTLGTVAVTPYLIYNVKSWTSNPNGSPDPVIVNDSLGRNTGRSGLSGTYTFGGVNPSFSSLAVLEVALQYHGVCGPVIVDFRNGIYSGTCKLNSIYGVSASNTITFRSENGDSSLVTLTSAATSSGTNYVMDIIQTPYVSFEKLTLEQTGSGYSNTLRFSGSPYCNVRNCVLKTSSNATNETNGTLLINSNCSDMEVKNCRFLNGYAAVSMRASLASLARRNRITNNICIGQQNSSLIFASQKSAVVSGNKISATNQLSNGIYTTYYNDSLTISQNLVTGNIRNGFSFTSTIDTVIAMSVYNNMVSVGSTLLSPPQSKAISLTGITGISLFYNSFNITTAASNGSDYALYYDNTADTIIADIRNNIFAASGLGNGINFQYSFPQFTSAYNVFWTPGGQAAAANSTPYTALSQWQATGQDANSFVADPQFLSAADLHSNEPVLRAGIPVALVNTDYDGVTRGIPPCIGADETAGLLNDAAVSRIHLQAPLCSGNQPVKITLRNLGTNNMTSAVVNWNVNLAAQPVYNWTGNMLPGDSVILTLGNYNFNPTGSYTVTAVSSLPNNTTDSFTSNDSRSVSFLAAALSGVYTIGGVSPSYPNIPTAIQDLTARGVCGAVTFNIRNGNYNTQQQIGQIPGASAINTITFQSESGDSTLVSVTYSSNTSGLDYVFKINGSDYLRIKRITINSYGSTNGNALFIAGDCDDLRIENNILNGTTVTNQSSGLDLVLLTGLNQGEQNRDMLFKGNILNNGATGIFATSTIRNLTVSGNTFNGQFVKAIDFSAMDTVMISGNTITTAPGNPNVTGIYLGLVGKEYHINGNIINSDGMGVRLLFGFATAASPVMISNNLFTGSGKAITIEKTNVASYVNVYYNTFRMTGAGTGIYLYNADGVNILNNNFEINGTGEAMSFTTITPVLTCNNNNLYAPSGVQVLALSVPYTLTAWQQFSGFDINSISITPAFLGPADVHVAGPYNLDGAAQVVAGVSTDFDNQPRSTTSPDIGADEFTMNALIDAAVTELQPNASFCGTASTVKVRVKNFGPVPITSVLIHYATVQTLFPVFQWNGNLLPGTDTLVTVGSISLIPGSNYTLMAWTSDPNGVQDNYLLNDTLIHANIQTRLSGNYIVGQNGDIPDLTTAINMLNTAGVCGPVTFLLRDGRHISDATLGVIQGVSAQNVVTFTSQSGDSSRVEISDSLRTSPAGIVLMMNGSHYVNFERVSFRLYATYSNYRNVIGIINGAGDIGFYNCVFYGSNWGAPLINSLNYDAIIYSGSNTNENNIIIKNNIFYYSNVAISMSGIGGGETGIQIENNRFCNQAHYGIYLGIISQPLIRNNTIYTLHNNDAYIACYLSGSKGNSIVNNNRITLHTGQYGIYFTGNQTTSTSYPKIYNNYIQIDSMVTASRALTVNCAYLQIANNTIRTNGPDGISAELSGTNVRFVANIIQHLGTGGYAFYNQGSTMPACNRNCYYAASATPFFYNTQSYPSLAAFRAATGYDQNSFDHAIAFHPLTPWRHNDTLINDSGFVSVFVAADIDNTIRNASTPDIGAYEFTPLALDGGIMTINSSSLNCVGTNTVTVTIQNFGTDTITQADFNWTTSNQAQPPYTWNGVLLPGATASVSVGSYVSPGGDQVRVWITNVNGTPDMDVRNDSIAHDRLAGNLSGIYTIGGNTPDFLTIHDAAIKLRANGICGSVNLKIRSGLYGGPFVFNTVPGNSTANPIVLESETGNRNDVIITTLADNSTTAALRLRQTDKFLVREIHFRLTPHTTTSYGTCLVADTTNELTVEHCLFTGLVQGVGVNSSCFSAGYARKLIVRENEFEIADAAIYTQAAPGDTVYVEHNNIAGSVGFGILSTGGNMHYIRHNYVHAPQGGTFSNTGNLEMKYNQFYGSSYGLTFNTITGSTPASPMVIANNFISKTVNFISITTTLFAHNTVDISGGSQGLSAISFADQINDITVQNNLFNLDGHTAYSMSSVFAMNYCNHNVYWSGGNTVYLLNSNALVPWQQLTGYDLNSDVLINPMFVNINYEDLHVMNAALVNTAVPIASLTDDIDGETRSATPCAGADEINQFPDNCELVSITTPNNSVCQGTNTVTAQIRNAGSNALTSVTVNWTVNQVAQAPFVWSGNLAPGQGTTFQLGSFTAVGPSDTIAAVCVLPNGQPDANTGNDSASIIHQIALSGVYTVSGNWPDYTNLVDAIADAEARGICGTVTFKIRNGNYTPRISIGFIKGTSPTDRLVIESESGDSSMVVFTRNQNMNNDYVFKIDSADHISIRKLTAIMNSNTANSFSAAVYIKNDADDIQVQNCSLSCGSNNITYDGSAAVCADGQIDNTNLDSILVENCRIDNMLCSFGVRIAGRSVTNPSKSAIVRNNYITVNTTAGVMISYVNTPITMSNTIVQTRSSNIGIKYISNKGIINTTGNFIQLLVPLTAGIEYMNIPYQADSVNITNNFIAAPSGADQAIRTYSVANVNILSNSTYLNSGTSLQLNNTIPANATVLNNSFVSTTITGPSCLDITSNTYTLQQCDYNNLYSPQFNLVSTPSATYNTLSAWQAASGNDPHSVSVTPPYTSATDLHLNAVSALSGSGITVAGVMNDIDGEQRSNVPCIGADEYGSSGTVWPGNTNNDSIVNAADVLVVGLHNGATGTPRALQGNTWAGHTATDWGQLQSNGNDLKHADSDGNGVIDAADTVAIALNFGHTEYYPIMAIENDQRNILPPLFMNFSAASYAPGAWVDADIILGDTASTPMIAYGIAGQIGIPLQYIMPGTIQIWPVSSWLVPSPVDGIGLTRADTTFGNAHFGITRMDHIDASGAGTIAKLRFKLVPIVPQLTTIYLPFAYDTAVTANSSGVPLNASTGSFMIDPVLHAGESAATAGWSIYPVPARDYCMVAFSAGANEKCTLKLRNNLGAVVKTQQEVTNKTGSQAVAFSLQGIAAGVYYLEVTSQNATRYLPLIVSPE